MRPEEDVLAELAQRSVPAEASSAEARRDSLVASEAAVRAHIARLEQESLQTNATLRAQKLLRGSNRHQSRCRSEM